MPWTETCAVDQRLRFVMEYELGEEPMAVLCQQYGISRKTGYKWLGRFLGEGPEALKDRSRAPRHHPNEVCAAVEQAILSLRGEHPRWGPKKLRVVLQRDDADHEATRMTAMRVTASHHQGGPDPTIKITAKESTAVSSAMASRYAGSARRSTYLSIRRRREDR